jgi:hypothetical protein
MKYQKLLGVVGLLGGSVALVSIMVVGDTFGFPGSAEYLTYEIFNRSMAVLLALQTCSLIAFFIGRHEVLGKIDKRVVTIALIAWAAMAIGTAAEFWLYSDLPYPRTPADFNMRVAAFVLFFLGSLTAGVALLVLVIRLFKRRIINSLFGAALVLYFPLYFLGLSIFIAPAVASIAISGAALTSRRDSTFAKKKAA